MQEELRTHRQILYDLVTRYLDPLPGTFARLAYLAELWKPASGVYEHPELCLVYTTGAVHHALASCHQELFERILELPLAEQQEEFHKYLGTCRDSSHESPEERRMLLQSWIPSKTPDYLKDLFQSNLLALWELMDEHKSRARSDR